MMTAQERVRTIVFLPKASAEAVSAKLAQGGYATIAVSTVSELYDALCSSDFALAVTTRANIDIVRHIQPMPVVNIEVFLDYPYGRELDGKPQRFDSISFLARVGVLTSDGHFGRRGTVTLKVRRSGVSGILQSLAGFLKFNRISARS